jgi:hypothetical protein
VDDPAFFGAEVHDGDTNRLLNDSRTLDARGGLES